MIMPHEKDVVESGVNNIALQYNSPLIKCDCDWNLPTFEPLYLQAVKRSEDGTMTVIRLSEQDGKRGEIKLDKPVMLLNMLEEAQGKISSIEYKPFEIITIGVKALD